MGSKISVSVILLILVLSGVSFYLASAPNGISDSEASASSSGASSEDSVSSLPVSDKIVIQMFAYAPQTVMLPVGSTVTWTNEDVAPHTITSDSGTELNSPQLSQRQTYEHTFSLPGTYTYHCVLHPTMRATIIIQ